MELSPNSDRIKGEKNPIQGKKVIGPNVLGMRDNYIARKAELNPKKFIHEIDPFLHDQSRLFLEKNRMNKYKCEEVDFIKINELAKLLNEIVKPALQRGTITEDFFTESNQKFTEEAIKIILGIRTEEDSMFFYKPEKLIYTIITDFAAYEANVSFLDSIFDHYNIKESEES